MGLNRNNYAVRGGKGVDGHHAQGGHTVDQHIIIPVFDGIDVAAQHRFPAHGVYKGNLNGRQLNIARHEVNAFRMAEDTLVRFIRFLQHAFG